MWTIGLAGGEDVGDGALGMVPVPDVEGYADVRRDLLRQRHVSLSVQMYGVGVRRAGAEMQRTEELEAEPDVDFARMSATGARRRLMNACRSSFVTGLPAQSTAIIRSRPIAAPNFACSSSR